MSLYVEAPFLKSFCTSLTNTKSWLSRFSLSSSLEELPEQSEPQFCQNSNPPQLTKLELQMMSELSRSHLKN